MGQDDRFLLKKCTDGSLVFDRHSGDTHALDPETSAIFLELISGNQYRPSLTAKLSSFYPDNADFDAESQLDKVLEHLERLGLGKVSLH